MSVQLSVIPDARTSPRRKTIRTRAEEMDRGRRTEDMKARLRLERGASRKPRRATELRGTRMHNRRKRMVPRRTKRLPGGEEVTLGDYSISFDNAVFHSRSCGSSGSTGGYTVREITFLPAMIVLFNMPSRSGTGSAAGNWFVGIGTPAGGEMGPCPFFGANRKPLINHFFVFYFGDELTLKEA